MKFFSDVAQCFTNEKYFSALLEGLKLTLAISVGAAIQLSSERWSRLSGFQTEKAAG